MDASGILTLDSHNAVPVVIASAVCSAVLCDCLEPFMKMLVDISGTGSEHYSVCIMVWRSAQSLLGGEFM
jgi:hypothetical protein